MRLIVRRSHFILMRERSCSSWLSRRLANYPLPRFESQYMNLPVSTHIYFTRVVMNMHATQSSCMSKLDELQG